MESPHLSQFGIMLLFIIGGTLFLVITLTVSKFLRPNRPNFEKLTSYECGEDAVGNPWGQFNPRFYIIALIFLLFEVEILFIFPWATVFGDASKIKASSGKWGWYSLIEMFLFVGILAIGLAYAWVKGFLEWVKPEPVVVNFKSPVPSGLYEELNKKYENISVKKMAEQE